MDIFKINEDKMMHVYEPNTNQIIMIKRSEINKMFNESFDKIKANKPSDNSKSFEDINKSLDMLLDSE